ncbi:MAG: NVEALA domain-containing protein [Muribaculaceae bacterium]|jgi:hypothetical protein|nr:NVEALA domain-containing protein [Muribaculaceae bacterium]
MKKKIIFAAVAAVMGICTYMASQGINRAEELDKLALANVEALSRYEITDGRWIVTVYAKDHWKCDDGGRASCPGTPW